MLRAAGARSVSADPRFNAARRPTALSTIHWNISRSWTDKAKVLSLGDVPNQSRIATENTRMPPFTTNPIVEKNSNKNGQKLERRRPARSTRSGTWAVKSNKSRAWSATQSRLFSANERSPLG